MTKSIYILILTFLSLFTFQFSFAQQNTTIDVKYRMKPNRDLAKETTSFYYAADEGKLYFSDTDLGINKVYLVKFKTSNYDNASLYNIVLETDVVNHTLKRLPKSDIGVFSIFYDEKNGKVMGIKTVFVGSELEIYLTEFGAKMLNK